MSLFSKVQIEYCVTSKKRRHKQINSEYAFTANKVANIELNIT